MIMFTIWISNVMSIVIMLVSSRLTLITKKLNIHSVNVDRKAQMPKIENFTSKTRLSHVKMNHHSLQQKIFTVNMSTCQPIYKTQKMRFFWYFQGSHRLSNPPVVDFFHSPTTD